MASQNLGLDQTTTVLYGNVKRLQQGKEEPSGPEDGRMRTPHLLILPEKVVPLIPGANYYGTVGLDLAVPRGPEGSPICLMIERPLPENQF